MARSSHGSSGRESSSFRAARFKVPITSSGSGNPDSSRRAEKQKVVSLEHSYAEPAACDTFFRGLKERSKRNKSFAEPSGSCFVKLEESMDDDSITFNDGQASMAQLDEEWKQNVSE